MLRCGGLPCAGDEAGGVLLVCFYLKGLERFLGCALESEYEGSCFQQCPEFLIGTDPFTRKVILWHVPTFCRS